MSERPAARAAMRHQLWGALRRWEEALAVFALGVVVAAVSYGVTTRYVTSTSATWATELASLSFTWVVFLGSAAAMKRNMHVSVDALTRLLPDKVARGLGWIMDLLVLAFLLYTVYLAALITYEARTRPSPVLRISFFWVYLSVVLGFASITVTHIRNLIRSFWEARR